MGQQTRQHLTKLPIDLDILLTMTTTASSL